MRFTCPCCGYKTLEDKPPGTYHICKICFWEDDDIQYNDPDYEGGANDVSLRQAQENFRKLGVSDISFIEFVREPTKKDIRDNNWKPFN